MHWSAMCFVAALATVSACSRNGSQSSGAAPQSAGVYCHDTQRNDDLGLNPLLPKTITACFETKAACLANAPKEISGVCPELKARWHCFAGAQASSEGKPSLAGICMPSSSLCEALRRGDLDFADGGGAAGESCKAVASVACAVGAANHALVCSATLPECQAAKAITSSVVVPADGEKETSDTSTCQIFRSER